MVSTEQMGWGVMDDNGWRKGPWTAEEDRLLIEHVKLHGEGRWNSVARFASLRRNGKSCRLRWVNYLRPDLKRGHITPHEERIIVELHARWGNRWSTIARSLPGRTDNEIKNYWRTHFKKKTTKINSSANNNNNNNSDNSRAKLLRRQQFKQQQQQQEQNQWSNQMDMKKIMCSSFDENNDNNNNRMSVTTAHQTWWSCPSVPDQEQGLLYSMLPGANSNEEIMCDGLWNLDDFHGGFNGSNSANKAYFLQPVAAPFY